MRSNRLGVIASYEVIGQPVVGPTRLTYVPYVPWVTEACAPYKVTRLPNCTIVGLWDALRLAEAQAAS